jgi:hypothetical protein
MAVAMPSVDYFADLDVIPFDLEEVTGPVAPVLAPASFEWETFQELQHWYDLGFGGVVEPGRRHPRGWETATTAQILAYCNGQADAATRRSRQTILQTDTAA